MLKIEKLIPGGFGLATDNDGKKIFLWNALPGEIIEEYKITKNKSNFSEGIATKIFQFSDSRVKPKDACFLSTSPWQIMDWSYEQKQKQELVVELFREHQIDIKTPKIISDGNDYFYRNKMEYALYFNNHTKQIDLAFHERGSHRKFPIKQSSIERPEIFHAATEIVADLNRRHEEARKYQSLLLRCDATGKVSGGLYENHKPHPVFPTLNDNILGNNYSYSLNGFFQINLPVYELALREIKDHIFTDKVLDLYSGVGTIGLSVASDKKLTLVECDKSAYGELVNNCKMFKDCSFVSICDKKNDTKALKELFSRPFATNEEQASEVPPVTTGRDERVEKKTLLMPNPVFAKSEEALDYIEPDQTVVLDPPRAGCDKKLIEKLLEVKPAKIIYLSCNPATQARDVKKLLEQYEIEEVKTFNFFPHTPHIENLVILSLF